MNNKTNFYSLRNFFIIAIALQLFRLFALYLNMQDFSLYVDEVYYWGWAQSFELGYFSKPPMIAWLIMLTTSIFGDGEIATKLGALLVYPITSGIIYLIANKLFKDEKIAFFSALSFITIPAISMSSIIISTDVVLLLFWSLSIYFFINALEKNGLNQWLLAGFFSGCGLLSKYNMIFFLISVVLVFILFKEHRKNFKNLNFYLALVVAFLVFLPNLYWQFSHDFISFAHTKEISQVEKDLFHMDKMFEFLGAQLGVFGIILFPILLFLIFNIKNVFKDKAMKLLYLFVIPYLLFITVLSLLSRAFANWAAPIYVAGIILVIAYLVQKQKFKLIKISIALNLFLAAILYFYHPLMNTFGIELTRKNDPYKRINGWEEVAKKIDKIQELNKFRLIFDDRKTMAEMIYYMRPHPFDALIYNPQNVVKNQFHMFNNLDKAKEGKFLFVTKTKSIKHLKNRFKNIELLENISIKLYKDFNRDYSVYLAEDFLGYKE